MRPAAQSLLPAIGGRPPPTEQDHGIHPRPVRASDAMGVLLSAALEKAAGVACRGPLRIRCDDSRRRALRGGPDGEVGRPEGVGVSSCGGGPVEPEPRLVARVAVDHRLEPHLDRLPAPREPVVIRDDVLVLEMLVAQRVADAPRLGGGEAFREQIRQHLLEAEQLVEARHAVRAQQSGLAGGVDRPAPVPLDHRGIELCIQVYLLEGLAAPRQREARGRLRPPRALQLARAAPGARRDAFGGRLPPPGERRLLGEDQLRRDVPVARRERGQARYISLDVAGDAAHRPRERRRLPGDVAGERGHGRVLLDVADGLRPHGGHVRDNPFAGASLGEARRVAGKPGRLVPPRPPGAARAHDGLGLPGARERSGFERGQGVLDGGDGLLREGEEALRRLASLRTGLAVELRRGHELHGARRARRAKGAEHPRDVVAEFGDRAGTRDGGRAQPRPPPVAEGELHVHGGHAVCEPERLAPLALRRQLVAAPRQAAGLPWRPGAVEREALGGEAGERDGRDGAADAVRRYEGEPVFPAVDEHGIRDYLPRVPFLFQPQDERLALLVAVDEQSEEGVLRRSLLARAARPRARLRRRTGRSHLPRPP